MTFPISVENIAHQLETTKCEDEIMHEYNLMRVTFPALIVFHFRSNMYVFRSYMGHELVFGMLLLTYMRSLEEEDFERFKDYLHNCIDGDFPCDFRYAEKMMLCRRHCVGRTSKTTIFRNVHPTFYKCIPRRLKMEVYITYIINLNVRQFGFCKSGCADTESIKINNKTWVDPINGTLDVKFDFNAKIKWYRASERMLEAIMSISVELPRCCAYIKILKKLKYEKLEEIKAKMGEKTYDMPEKKLIQIKCFAKYFSTAVYNEIPPRSYNYEDDYKNFLNEIDSYMKESPRMKNLAVYLSGAIYYVACLKMEVRMIVIKYKGLYYCINSFVPKYFFTKEHEEVLNRDAIRVFKKTVDDPSIMPHYDRIETYCVCKNVDDVSRYVIHMLAHGTGIDFKLCCTYEEFAKHYVSKPNVIDVSLFDLDAYDGCKCPENDKKCGCMGVIANHIFSDPPSGDKIDENEIEEMERKFLAYLDTIQTIRMSFNLNTIPINEESMAHINEVFEYLYKHYNTWILEQFPAKTLISNINNSKNDDPKNDDPKNDDPKNDGILIFYKPGILESLQL